MKHEHKYITRTIEDEELEIPAVKNRELFIKTCDLMYSHYRILQIVDIDTAINIIKGVLKE